MKYLKKYQIFESGMKSAYSEEEVIKTDKVIDNLRDILLELSDMGYTTRVDYKVISPRLINQKPQIQINITKKSEDILLPLWNNEDEKEDFDYVILRVLRYAVGEGYKYEYAGITTGAVIKGQVVNYSIRLYKY
jgi:hypothetical protein